MSSIEDEFGVHVDRGPGFTHSPHDDCTGAKHEPEPEPTHYAEDTFDAARFVDAAIDEIKRTTDPTPAQELTSWYVAQARGEIEQLTAKMAEYGGAGRAVDLIQIGQDLAAIGGREVDDEEAAELGVYFYLRGKLSRWTAALLEGRRVSDDTLHDIGVYVRMAQRIRKTGGWPV